MKLTENTIIKYLVDVPSVEQDQIIFDELKQQFPNFNILVIAGDIDIETVLNKLNEKVTNQTGNTECCNLVKENYGCCNIIQNGIAEVTLLQSNKMTKDGNNRKDLIKFDDNGIVIGIAKNAKKLKLNKAKNEEQ